MGFVFVLYNNDNQQNCEMSGQDIIYAYVMYAFFAFWLDILGFLRTTKNFKYFHSV
jgi:hypothetical protein